MEDKKPFFILIASQKGGVGKTTIAINLAVSLIYQDYKVLLIDSDIDTASLANYLGIKGSGKGYKEAMTGEAEVGDVIFAYESANLHLIVGNTADNAFTPQTEKLNRFYTQLQKMDYDFVIIDTPPGYFNEYMAKYLNEVIIVTTPDEASASSSSKLSAYCAKFKVEHRMVINRAGYSKFELDKEGVERLFGDVAYAIIPEDRTVQEAVAKHKPAYMIDEGSPFSLAINELSRAFTLKVGQPVETKQMQREEDRKLGLFGRLTKWSSKPPE